MLQSVSLAVKVRSKYGRKRDSTSRERVSIFHIFGLFCFNSRFQGFFKRTASLSLAVIKYILNDLQKEVNLFVNLLDYVTQATLETKPLALK